MPPNPQNLKPKPWPKGKSGNPKGRPPKGQAFNDLLYLIKENPNARKLISQMWLSKILKGDYQFFREYLERMDGKVALPVQDTTPDISELESDILIKIPDTTKKDKPKNV